MGERHRVRTGPVVRRLLLCFLALVVAVATGAAPLVRTPRGIHCPTAQVQTVTVAVKNCCGKVTHVEVRKPKLGEQGFKQCQCAEKRSSDHQAEIQRTVLKAEGLPLVPFRLELPIRLPEPVVLPASAVRLVQADLAPPVPPPPSA